MVGDRSPATDTCRLPLFTMNNRHTKPEDLFRAEKERALTVRNSQHARLLAEAKAAFDKLMAEGQAARKSGRPRKHPLPPLKTSSSRTPPQPAAPPKPASIAPVAAPVSQAISATSAKQPAAAAKPVKPTKPAKAAAAPAKSAKAVRAKKVVKAAAKPKTKAKRSSRR